MTSKYLGEDKIMSQPAIDHQTPDKIETVDKKYLKHRSILVIDDEHGIRNFLVKGLSRFLGFIESAEDLESAEALRQRCHFDLIIADIKLPGGSGVEWVHSLRESGCRNAPANYVRHAGGDGSL